jgi:hypothetical protein
MSVIRGLVVVPEPCAKLRLLHFNSSPSGPENYPVDLIYYSASTIISGLHRCAPYHADHLDALLDVILNALHQSSQIGPNRKARARVCLPPQGSQGVLMFSQGEGSPQERDSCEGSNRPYRKRYRLVSCKATREGTGAPHRGAVE